MGNVCAVCNVPLDEWPYPRQINGICVDCHKDGGSTWGLLATFYDEYVKESAQ